MRKAIGSEYAQALYELTSSLDELYEFIELLEIFQQSMRENTDFYAFLKHPKISSEEKKEVIADVLPKIPERLLHFLFVLVDNGRILELFDVIHQLKTSYYKSKNMKHFDVYSIEELSQGEKNKIEETLEKQYGVKAHLSFYLDKTLLGGLKIIFNGSVLEYSVLENLKNIKEILKNKKLR